MKELLFCIALCGFAVGGYGSYTYQNLSASESTNLVMYDYRGYKQMKKDNEKAELLMLAGFSAGGIFILGAISVLVGSRKKAAEQPVEGQIIK
ncbi:hypothetical protein WNY58_16310 [Neptuniibacter pectenicola]|uniref:Uncharacterized protein n=1 Tax=Neptuniibacter pectenicola TaxID=1806669 RepID=A0ABU9TXH0_9GAMM